MTTTLTRQELGAIGGRTRAANQTPAERTASARRAGQARGTRIRAAALRTSLDKSVQNLADNINLLTDEHRRVIRDIIARSP